MGRKVREGSTPSLGTKNLIMDIFTVLPIVVAAAAVVSLFMVVLFCVDSLVVDKLSDTNLFKQWWRNNLIGGEESC